MRKIFFVLAISILIVSCSTPTPEVIVVTATDEPPTETLEVRPTNTPFPTPTPPPPTATSAPTEASTISDDIYALNYLGSYEVEGVSVEVIRVLFGSAEAVSDYKDVSLDQWSEYAYDTFAWTNMTVIGEVVIRYTNNRDEPVELAFGSCGENLLLVSGQQISFNDVGMDAVQNLCHDPLYPQSSVIQGVWFPMKNISADDINEATLILECPNPVDGYGCIGSDWNIKIDLSDHRYDELPDELK